jgi:hypothetical protein
VSIKSFGRPGDGDERTGEPVFESEYLNVGDRIRFTLVWDSCPADMGGFGPSSVATDYDIFLWNADTHEYLYASQSVSDNTEGFDVTIPSGASASGRSWAGKYVVYRAWPKGSGGCGDAGAEPFSWAATRWVTPPPPR